MDHRKLENYFFVSLLISVGLFSAYILSPYIYPLIIALVISIVFRPVYNWFVRMLRSKTLASIVTVITFLITILLPTFLVGIQLTSEINRLYDFFINQPEGIALISKGEVIINGTLQDLSLIPPETQGFTFQLTTYVKNILDWTVNNIGVIFGSFSRIALDLFIFILALYYLLKEGYQMKEIVIRLSPLKDRYDEEIISKLKVAVNSVIKGSVVIAVIQGFLTALGFVVFGIDNPALWGSVAGIASFIPAIGTAVVTLPAAIYLFVGGHHIAAIGLAIWGLIGIGLIDNILYPLLVKRGVKIHSFFILLSVIAGLTFFGPLGVLIGPLTLSLFFALLDIYAISVKESSL